MWNIFDGMFARKKTGFTAKPVADKHNYVITDNEGSALYAGEMTENEARRKAAKYAVTDGVNNPHYIYKLVRIAKYSAEVKEENE